MGDVLTPDREGPAELRSDQGQGTRAQAQKERIHDRGFRRPAQDACARWARLAISLGMIPGLKKIAGQADSEEAKRELMRIQAIIDSMTLQERRNHLMLNGHRRRRVSPKVAEPRSQDVNRFIKQFEQTRKMMKKITKRVGPETMMRGLGLGARIAVRRERALMGLVIRLRRHGAAKDLSTVSWWPIAARRVMAAMSIRLEPMTRPSIRQRSRCKETRPSDGLARARCPLRR